MISEYYVIMSLKDLSNKQQFELFSEGIVTPIVIFSDSRQHDEKPKVLSVPKEGGCMRACTEE